MQYKSAWKRSLESLCISIFISNQQKCYVFFIISYVFPSTKSEIKRAEQVLPERGGSRRWWEEGEVNEKMYTHVSKCKIDEVKERKNTNCVESHSR
jgi:hypothetical protein